MRGKKVGQEERRGGGEEGPHLERGHECSEVLGLCLLAALLADDLGHRRQHRQHVLVPRVRRLELRQHLRGGGEARRRGEGCEERGRG